MATSDRSFFLWIGLTLASFQIFGTLLELIEKLKYQREEERVVEQVLWEVDCLLNQVQLLCQ